LKHSQEAFSGLTGIISAGAERARIGDITPGIIAYSLPSIADLTSVPELVLKYSWRLWPL